MPVGFFPTGNQDFIENHASVLLTCLPAYSFSSYSMQDHKVLLLQVTLRTHGINVKNKLG
jgi:hypothetical protein